MTRAELDELREAWARDVLGLEFLPGHRVTLPCVFSRGAQAVTARIDAGPCEGPIEGAHWIKRQTVERWVEGFREVRQLVDPHTEKLYIGGAVEYVEWSLAVDDLVQLAAWDPRNGVPACERHHRIFDSQRVPLPSEQIVVWRHQVPAHVEAFALDWGLEHELDRKHDSIGGGV